MFVLKEEREQEKRETLGREEAEEGGGALHGECTDIPSCSSSLAFPPLAIRVAQECLRP